MKAMTATMFLTLALPALGQEFAALGDFSLEDLMQVEVTSVSKKPQQLANVAAAVYVITAEDIRLSGAQSIPEALRLAPGVDATRISGGSWAVSIRGSAFRFANKLLVLVDGRNAYSPAFSGVFWEDFQFPIEDIERIEVLRGPAATIWGTNGVNGVINIITKSAAATQGGQAVVGVGNVEGSYGRVRYGVQDSEGSLFYRMYAATQNARTQEALNGGSGQDNFRHQSAGFRIDSYRKDGSHWDASGDFYSVRANVLSMLEMPGMVFPNPDRETHDGATLRTRFETLLADGSNLQFQGAYAHSNISIGSTATDQRDTVDLDAQHRFKWGDRHEIVWGGDYRLTDDTMPIKQLLIMDQVSRRTVSYGLFGQDEIKLTDNWRLTLGLRADHNEFTGWEIQPDARFAWNLEHNHTLWGSLSKVARAPSRGDHGRSSEFVSGSYDLGYPYGTVPVVVHPYSQGDTSAELKAAQLGWRSQWIPTFSTDIVAFAHQYDGLPAYGTLTYSTAHAPAYVDAYIPVVATGSMKIHGLELSSEWRFAPKWRMQLAHTWRAVPASDLVDAMITPSHVTSLRTSWAPAAGIDVDVTLRHMGRLPGDSGWARNAYNSVDARIAWWPRKNVELALIGQNLNNGACTAYAGIVNPEAVPLMVPTCLPRSLMGQIRADF